MRFAVARGCLVAVTLSWGCATQPPPPVVDRSVSQLPANGIHEVRAGETLYAIAFRYGRDVRELAAINGIGAPYVIHPGQRLRVTGTAHTTPPERERRRSAAPAKLHWTWPASGKLVKAFGSQSKGIDVAGKVGDPVRAAADGEVVYAGSGLRGYGKLVIVKHDERTLSAYGYNSALSVTEGALVKAGQRVARMGRRGDRGLVHFEIRRDGKPLDPVTLLPPR